MSESNLPMDYEWLSSVASDALISAKEIHQMFGYKSDAIWGRVKRGEFPDPDLKMKSNLTAGKPRIYWKACTVRKEIKRILDDHATA